MDSTIRYLRQLKRLALVSYAFAGAALSYLLRRGWNWTLRERALWMQKLSGKLLRAIGFEVRSFGALPSGGFIAPNHLSYVDILVLGSLSPQVFLSRNDVSSWPIIGKFTRIAGTLYIDRSRRSDVANRDADFRAVLESGSSVTVFLEGTSSDGRTVLPFRSSLLEAVVRNGWSVTPAYLEYECEGGDASQEVCWWGGMEFGGHLLRMLRIPKTRATVVFGETIHSQSDRKRLALDLHDSVVALRAELDRSRQEKRKKKAH